VVVVFVLNVVKVIMMILSAPGAMTEGLLVD
jgi:hypothetical protein